MDTQIFPAPEQPALWRRITGLTLLILLAAVFFFSAWSKIHNDNAFDNFQWTFIDLGINSFLAAGIIARVMIGLEVALGLFLLLHIALKKVTYPAVIALLAIFIIYLIFVIAKQGNTGDCGCFGDKLAMKPLAAIIKNVVMIAATFVLMRIYPGRQYKAQEYVAIFAAATALTTPFLLNIMYTGTAPVPFGKQVDLAPLYKYTPAPSEDLQHGKHIIAFMSLTCPHCKKAAYLMSIIHKQHPDYPLYMVLDGPDAYQKAFFDETHAQDVPHLLYFHTMDFMQMAGNDGVPAIFWVNNGVVEYKSKYAYYQLDPKFMGEWLKK